MRSTASQSRPDLALQFAPVYYVDHGFRTFDQGHAFTIAAVLLRPKSRGEITLRSDDPFADPVIDPNYLSAPTDKETLKDGFELIRNVGQATPFDDYRGEELHPGAEIRTEVEIANYIADMAQTDYHPVGTCKMGTDELAVVDDRLRVHGVDGLRVVDASIMPTIPGGNTNAPTIMIGEKAAALIEADRES